MILTKEQMNDIIFQVTEKVLLRMPEVLGNLMQEHAGIHKIVKEFYSKYPQFEDKKVIVQKVLSNLESSYPALEYDELLEKAVPIIEKDIEILNKCDIHKTKKLSELNLDTNGVL